MHGVVAAVQLREITPESLHAVLDLAVAPDQRQFVATNARSIAEAHFEPPAWFRAVVDGEKVVMRLAFG
jgi:diamine N-acetyltransferase